MQQSQKDNQTTKCPKCRAVSGDDWSQCKGVCPMPMSPYFYRLPKPMQEVPYAN